MAKISLKEETKTEAAPAADEPNTTSAVAIREERPLAQYIEDTDTRGEYEASDYSKSYLVIVAKTGEMSNLFTPGDLVVNKEFVLGGTKNPIEVVALVKEKRYQNDLPFGDEIGDEVDIAMEVLDKGGVLEYRPFEDKKSTHFWKPVMRIVFLIKRPEGLNPEAAALFPFVINGADYGFFGYMARTKTAYRGIAVPLNDLKRAKGAITGTTFRLSTKGESWVDPKSGEPKSWIQPALRRVGDTSAEVLEFIKQNPAK